MGSDGRGSSVTKNSEVAVNKDQKATLKTIAGILDATKSDLANIAQELHDEFDDLSEKAQEGEKGEALNELADKLDEFDSSLDGIVTELNGLTKG